MDVTRMLDENGYFIVPEVLTPEKTSSTSESLKSMKLSRAGTRNLLELPWCRDLAQQVKNNPTVSLVLPSNLVAIQCTLFDKSEERNWLVTMHQDLSIPVSEKVEHPSLENWSRKEGQYFVQPPVEILEQLLAVRVHIDDCDSGNGPLRIVPGSHRHGRISQAAANQLRSATSEATCTVNRGGAHILRPLLLHASSRATSPRSRKVLHFLFGPKTIGFGLRWPHTA